MTHLGVTLGQKFDLIFLTDLYVFGPSEHVFRHPGSQKPLELPKKIFEKKNFFFENFHLTTSDEKKNALRQPLMLRKQKHKQN